MSADRLAGADACPETEGTLAELALGILPGDQRALVLVHLDRCGRCRGVAQKLSLSADTLLQLAPEAEPPVGFEVGLFERLRISEPGPEVMTAPRRISPSLARLSRRGRAMIVTAAATLTVGLGFGAGWLANPGPSLAVSPYDHGLASATATLSSDTGAVGTVATFAGTPGWMLMTVHSGKGSGWVTCNVTVAGGGHVTVGTFRLDDGYGAWSARLPVPASAIRSAQVVTASGGVLGSATLAA